MADGKCPGLPLEQRIGSIRDGEVTNFGPLIRSNPLTIQPTRRPAVADDIVTRLAQEIDSLKADPQVLRDAIVELERLRVENAEQAQGWRAERALADQLADALGNEWPGISNKPYSDVSTAHAATTAALSAWQEARRG